MQPLNTRGKAPEHPKKSKGRLPKSHTSRQNLNTFIMEQMNFHKQKLYSLIAAGVALVALLLPWVSINFLGASQSWNGLRGWGLLSLVGIGGVVALSFIGNKSDDYTAEYKKYVMIAFGAVAAAQGRDLGTHDAGRASLGHEFRQRYQCRGCRRAQASQQA